jgi:hypothetical protein
MLARLDVVDQAAHAAQPAVSDFVGDVTRFARELRHLVDQCEVGENERFRRSLGCREARIPEERQERALEAPEGLP